MCRIFAYTGSSADELETLYSALREAASHDEIAERLKIGFSRHGDGWGYVILNGDGSIFHYRSAMPIYEDRHTLPRPNGNFMAVFHAREATDKSTKRAIFSQPFVERSAEKTIFFAHNGYVDTEKLAEKLGFKGLATDSELAAKLISSAGIEQSIDTLKEYTKSALNIIILSLDRKGGVPELYYMNYYVIKERADYYQMYTVRLPKGRAVCSSTMTLFGIKGEKVQDERLTKL